MDILKKIVRHKRKEVERFKVLLPFEKLKALVQPTERCFCANIQGKSRVSLIAEVKKKSPSKWELVQDLDLESLVALYNNYASAISVLTDAEFFWGSFEDLEKVRLLTDLPILCKDFVIDEYQIYKARYSGADCILLIVSCLEQSLMQKLYEKALELGMDAIFEIHNSEELNKVLNIKWIKIIWINNRDLKTLEVDLNRTSTIAPSISNDYVLISESWFSSALDLLPMKWVVDAVLIWSSIMTSSDKRTTMYDLSSLPEIKICGITNLFDAKKAEFYWASYLGLIFTEESPRCIDKALAMIIRENIRYSRIVWVFVNNEIVFIKKILPFIDIIQLSGEEDDAYIEKLREITDKPIWKSVAIRSKVDLKVLPNYCDKVLLDTYHPEKKWWTWEVFDWSILESLNVNRNIVLAWWINPENVSLASKYAHVLDIGSWVEKSVGLKDENKLKSLFRAIRM